jgi:hypothetical protein
MNQGDLRTLLSQLHSRLSGGSPLADEDRQLLATVLADIEKALAKGPPTSPPDVSRFESLAVKFEAEHPAIAGTLRRVVDSLAKAGI